MKYALLEHKHGDAKLVNYGDHIQSLAAKQFLPQVDFYIERDKLNGNVPDEAKIILNGWFTYAPENWPPNPKLDALILSFHLNPRYADKLLDNKAAVDYIVSKGPVGCRDFRTLKIFQDRGIESYYSFCMTTTLGYKYKRKSITNKIYIVDVLYEYDQRYVYKADPKRIAYHLASGRIFKTMNLPKKNKLLREILPKEIIDVGIERNHFCDNRLSTEKMYEIAENALLDYASAKVVVTSRIHCALPCLAMGTPVLFVFNGLSDEAGHMSRFRGTVNHLNILTRVPKSEVDRIFEADMNVFHPDDIDWDNPPENPTSYRPYAAALIEKCKAFVSNS